MIGWAQGLVLVMASEDGGDASTAEKKTGHQPANAPDKEASARATFVTGIDSEPKRRRDAHRGFGTLESTDAGPRITEHHTDLKNLALDLDKRMGALLKEHEKDFFLAYKTHMVNVQKEIRALKLKADLEEAKTREDTKIKALEVELDWFMTEALRLDELCKGYKKEVDKWKAKAGALDEDRRFLEDQIKGAKRQNKILRAAAERARSSAYSALMATKGRTEGSEQLAISQGAPMAAVRARPSSAGASGARQYKSSEVRSRTPDPQSLSRLSSSGSLKALTNDTGGNALMDASGDGSPVGVSRHLLGSKAEERYVEAIKTFKESITREQHTIRMLQAARSTTYSKKSELEEFFLKCIDEARRDLNRRRHLTMHKAKSEREKVLEEVLDNEDVLVCLYEKLFPHRTGMARSLGGDDGRLMALEPVDHKQKH